MTGKTAEAEARRTPGGGARIQVRKRLPTGRPSMEEVGRERKEGRRREEKEETKGLDALGLYAPSVERELNQTKTKPLEPW